MQPSRDIPERFESRLSIVTASVHAQSGGFPVEFVDECERKPALPFVLIALREVEFDDHGLIVTTLAEGVNAFCNAFCNYST